MSGWDKIDNVRNSVRQNESSFRLNVQDDCAKHLLDAQYGLL